MQRARPHLSAIAWIAVFALLSTIAGIYILTQQRVRLPNEERYSIRVAVSNAGAVAPGFGQAVTVSGVKVGLISAVELRDGIAVITASVDPSKLPRVYSNASAILAPKTPLKDMELDLAPGGPPAEPLRDGGMIPLNRTGIPVDADELSAALDSETRDYFRILLSAAGVGFKDRGGDFRAILRSSRATVGQLRRINAAVAGRRRDLSALVSNLNEVAGALADESPSLARLIESGNTTLEVTGSENAALGSALVELPPTLAATRKTLGSLRSLSSQAAPAFDALVPAAKATPDAIEAGDPLLTRSEPFLRDDVRPLVRDAQPFARATRPTIERLSSVTPSLTRVFQVLKYVENELAYDPPGEQKPYLFWVAWSAHNVSSAFNVGDANGAILRGVNLFGCNTVAANPNVNALANLIAAPALSLCPKKK